MLDPTAHEAIDGTASEQALPPADRVLLFALLPQVVGSSFVCGLSAWQLFPMFAAMGSYLPPWTDRFHCLASPPVPIAFGLLGIALGVGVLHLPASPVWRLRLLHALGWAYLVVLVVWVNVVCLPMHYLIKSMEGYESPWLRHYAEIALLPFLLPTVALIRSGYSQPRRLVPVAEAAQVVVLLAAIESGIDRDPAQMWAVQQDHGPFPWDLAMIGYGMYGTLAGSLVANALLGWLLYARPNQRALWGPYFVLTVSAATIIVCSRKLGYWCATF